MTVTHKREFDLVVFGATGFTGRLVAEYLAKHSPKNLKWAIAGRTAGKLEDIKASLPEGRLLVEACVAARTHYCDLTGEPPFVVDIISRFHTQAREADVCIVPCSGYDSMPADLGAFMVAEEVRKQHNVPCRLVHNGFINAKGGWSSGTVSSLLGVLDWAGTSISRICALFDPFSFSKHVPGQPSRGIVDTIRSSDAYLPWYSRTFGEWSAPFVMSPINLRVIRRSAALLLEADQETASYAPDMLAYESMVPALSKPLNRLPTPLRFVFGFFVCALVAFATTMMMLVFTIGPIRRFVQGKLPAGHGPAKEVREAGFFEHECRGVTAAPSSKTGKIETVRGRIYSDGDPGYKATARLIANMGLHLALDVGPAGTKGGARAVRGVVTPAAAGGHALLNRLRSAGIVFKIL